MDQFVGIKPKASRTAAPRVVTILGATGSIGRSTAEILCGAPDEFTVADILMAHVLNTDELLAPYPRVQAYRARCRARPSWQRTIDRYCARVEAA